MNLKQLIQEVEDLRARGLHPLTPVVIRDQHSETDVGGVRVTGWQIEIHPDYPEPLEDRK